MNILPALLQLNSGSSWNIGFVQLTITKLADKMTADYQFGFCGHSNFVTFNQNSFNLSVALLWSL